ncbi:MAG: DUF1592 domain-containing protein, partial [Pirellulaceae bacterium]|nr:DUF1592 domain-containing protein [Pirellulaceae bacterium]
QAGHARKGSDRSRVAIYDREGLLIEVDDLKYFGGGGRSQSFQFNHELTKGDHRFFVEPIEADEKLEVGKTRSERFAKLSEAEIRDAEKRREKPLKPDDDIDEKEFPFMLRKAGVEGPTKIPQHLLPPHQNKILRRHAQLRDGRWRDVEVSAIESLTPFLRQVFRSPVTKEEVKPYAQLVVQACDRGQSYYRGMQVAITAALVSPRFLFRIETPPENWKPSGEDGAVALTQHQLATRLSYFLWSSTPDEQLLHDADQNRLSGKTLQEHVRRMLADPKSEALATQFAAQWLGLRNLEQHEADTNDTFTQFDPELMKSMSRETELLFAEIVRGNKPITELLTADYTFVNSDLAKHYGIDHDSSEFQRVSLQGTPRRGILSHASVLTLTSNSTRTSPVKRGKWILENVLGTPPPDPPANVPELEETKTADDNASLRVQLELHRESPTCASCHRVMDQLGFGLENFDAIGRYRTQENSLPVDASGVLPGGREFDGSVELVEVLGRTERDAFAKTAFQRLLTFALGRELSPSDRCVVDDLVGQAKANDYRLVDLIMAVVESRPFQYYDWPVPQ